MAGFMRIDGRLKYGIAWVQVTRKELDADCEEDFISWLMHSYKMPESVARGVYNAWNIHARFNNEWDSANRYVKMSEKKKKAKEEFNKRFSKIEEQLERLTDETEKKVKAETRK